jgi:hypothetical protein
MSTKRNDKLKIVRKNEEIQTPRFFVAGYRCNVQLLHAGGAVVKEFKSGAEAMKQV